MQDKYSRLLAESGVVEGDVMLDLGSVAGYLAGQELVKSEHYRNIRDSIRDGSIGDYEQAVAELQQLNIPEEKARTLATILKNEGVYVHTTYKAFRDPSYRFNVDPEAKKRFIAWMKSEPQYEGWSDDHLESEVSSILGDAASQQSLFKAIANTHGLAKKMGALKWKKDMPQVWKDLLGEEVDPIAAISHSIANTAHLLETHKSLQNIVQDGLENGYIWNPDDKDTPIHPKAENIDTGKSVALSPLSGYRALPEFIEALGEFYRPRSENAWWNALLKLEGISQRAKTIWSPVAMSRQIPSNMLNEGANGISPHKIVSAFKEVVADIKGTDDDSIREMLLDLTRRKVLEESVDLNTIADRESIDLAERALEEAIGSKSNYQKLRFMTSLPAKLYQAMDSIFKIAAFKVEYQRYRESLPTQGQAAEAAAKLEDGFKKQSQDGTLNEQQVAQVDKVRNDFYTDEHLKQMSAEIVRDTHPTYSLIAPTWQTLKRMPLGNFISFQTEVVRNAVMRNRHLAREWRDPRLRHIAMKRLVGQAASTAFPTALATASRLAFGVDWADAEAMREHDAPWAENSTVALLGMDGNGNMVSVDLGYVNPLGFAVSGVNAFRREGEWKDAALAALGEVFEPYIAPKLVTNAIAEIKANQKANGTKIYNEHDTDARKFDAWMDHLYKALEPGALTTARKTLKHLQHGEIRDAGGQLFALAGGFRVRYTDIDKSLFYDGLDHSREGSDITSLFTKPAKDKYATDEDVLDGYQRMEMARRKEFVRLHEKVVTAEQLLNRYDSGVKDYDPTKTLREAGVAAYRIPDIIEGNYKPFIPSELSHIDRLLKAGPPKEIKDELIKRREKKLDMMAYTATGPGGGAEGERVMQAMKSLEDREMDKVEQAVRVVRQMNRGKISSRMTSIMKDVPREYRDVLRDSARREAERQLSEEKFDWREENRERLGRLNLTQEEFARALQELGERYVP